MHEQLRQQEATQTSKGLQAHLQAQIQKSKAKASTLKKRMRTLIKEKNQARLAVQQTRAILGLVVCTFTLLLLSNVLGWSRTSSNSHGRDRIHPAIIPGIDSQGECEQRASSVWANDECLDFEHDPSF